MREKLLYFKSSSIVKCWALLSATLISSSVMANDQEKYTVKTNDPAPKIMPYVSFGTLLNEPFKGVDGWGINFKAGLRLLPDSALYLNYQDDDKDSKVLSFMLDKEFAVNEKFSLIASIGSTLWAKSLVKNSEASFTPIAGTGFKYEIQPNMALLLRYSLPFFNKIPEALDNNITLEVAINLFDQSKKKPEYTPAISNPDMVTAPQINLALNNSEDQCSINAINSDHLFIQSIYFGVDQKTINANAQDVVLPDDVLQDLQNKVIYLFGYADKAGTDDYNYRVALKRAKFVKQALALKYDIDEDSIVACSRGSKSAKFSSISEVDPLFRRVDIYISQ